MDQSQGFCVRVVRPSVDTPRAAPGAAGRGALDMPQVPQRALASARKQTNQRQEKKDMKDSETYNGIFTNRDEVYTNEPRREMWESNGQTRDIGGARITSKHRPIALTFADAADIIGRALPNNRDAIIRMMRQFAGANGEAVLRLSYGRWLRLRYVPMPEAKPAPTDVS
ncbi:MAG: hypothetical protein ACYCOR_19130 [Acidobacteriaceae bacterium]